MHIESVSSGTGAFQALRQSASSSFGEILKASKAATQATTQTANIAGSISDFQAWTQTYVTNPSISTERREQVLAQAQKYETILNKASASHSSSAKAFLKSLSPEELETIQHIQCLADPIKPDGLSEEGASNLLRAPDQAEDLDHDGYMSVGLALMWTFPPHNAPAEVRQAWDDACAGLDGGERLLMMTMFMPIAIPGNRSGSAYLDENTSYSDLVGKVLDMFEQSARNSVSSQQDLLDKRIAFLKTFLEKLPA